MFPARNIPLREVKREVIEEKDLKFRILLPNSTTIELKLSELRSEIPIQEFKLQIKKEYNETMKRRTYLESKSKVNWDYPDIHFIDEKSNIIKHKINVCDFVPNKWHFLWLIDGSARSVYQGMWDLNEVSDILDQLYDDCAFENAFTNIIDKSLEALRSNGGRDRRLISVELLPNKVSIFYSGAGMEGADENQGKWRKMVASWHQSIQGKTIEGDPAFFGMSGYECAVAAMRFGKHAVISSKTKTSNKVFRLHLEREAVTPSKITWRTKGATRDPLKEERENSPHGSFTKVEIFDLRVMYLNIRRFQCKLKDIFFPNIKSTSVSDNSNTPLEFLVNGRDLSQVEGGEISITNLHSCEGPDFVVKLHFRFNQESSSMCGQKAKAKLKCVYIPMDEGKENIMRILETLDGDGCGVGENFESFSRVSIRCSDRLLPDARWASLPFMLPKHDEGRLACFSRVKCFIDTDFGFKTTPYKTDLDQRHPYTIALRNFGSTTSENGNEVDVEIYKDGKKISLTELEEQYKDWISEMHNRYDCEEMDLPPLIVVPFAE